MTALLAWPAGQKAPAVRRLSDRCIRVDWPEGRRRTVSFDAAIRGDIQIDLESIREQAAATDPCVLWPSGKQERVSVGGDTYRVEWLAKETFDEPDWLSRFCVEGDSEVKVVDGRLSVRNGYADKANVATIWYRRPLPDDVIVRFRTKAILPAESNAANLNLFLHGRESDGGPLQFGRSGQYALYHQIPNYIITFVGGVRDGWSRVRRDPGFNLMHESNVRSEVDRLYELCVTLHDGRLRYYIDGKRIHDVQDDNPLPGGHFAIRTWSTDAWWDDIEFGRVIGAD